MTVEIINKALNAVLALLVFIIVIHMVPAFRQVDAVKMLPLCPSATVTTHEHRTYRAANLRVHPFGILEFEDVETGYTYSTTQPFTILRTPNNER